MYSSPTEQIVNAAKLGKALHDEISSKLRNLYLIKGKSIDNWNQQFNVVIPQNPSLSECRSLMAHIALLHQEASRIREECEALYVLLKETNKSSVMRATSDIVGDFREKGEKIPARDTLKELASNKTRESAGALAHAEVAMNFFSRVVERLIGLRKALENIVLNISIERKE